MTRRGHARRNMRRRATFDDRQPVIPTGILKSCPNVACQFREHHLNFNPKCDVVVKVARLTAAVRYAVVLFRYSLMIFTTVASLKYCDMGD